MHDSNYTPKTEQPVVDTKQKWSRGEILRVVAAVACALGSAMLYAVVTVAVFSLPSGNEFLSTMTCGFLFLVPVAMGALTIHLSPIERRGSQQYAIFMPWISVVLAMLVIAAFEMELIICLIMALPLFLALASLGGYLFHRKDAAARADTKVEISALGFLLLAPYVVTPLELQMPNPDSVYTVQNQIVIEADAETVWRNIIEVPMIQPEEQRFSVFHMLGLPKPMEATLSHEGIGGVRYGAFEDNLVFIEEITAWNEYESLSFTIQSDRQQQIPELLKEIGGQYFDTVGGTYRIEQIDAETVILHFSSTHRLSTRFDFYGSIWTRWAMWDLQEYILEIVKGRSEAQVLF